MKNFVKFFCVAALAVAAAFSMAGCPENGGDALEGTWTAEESGGITLKITAENGNWVLSNQNASIDKGSYSISGESVTLTVTHVNLASGKTEWKEVASLPEEQKALYGGERKGTLSGDKFTVAEWGATFTKE